jgi:hypothetical protein
MTLNTCPIVLFFQPEIIEKYSLDQPPSHLYYLAYNPAVGDPHNGVAVTEFLPTLSTQEEAYSIDDRTEPFHCVITQSGLTAEESQIGKQTMNTACLSVCLSI